MFCHCSYEHPTEAIAVSSPCFVGYGAAHRQKPQADTQAWRSEQVENPTFNGGATATNPNVPSVQGDRKTVLHIRAGHQRLIPASDIGEVCGGSTGEALGHSRPYATSVLPLTTYQTRAGSTSCKIVRSSCRELVLGYDFYPRPFRYAGTFRHPHYRRHEG